MQEAPDDFKQMHHGMSAHLEALDASEKTLFSSTSASTPTDHVDAPLGLSPVSARMKISRGCPAWRPVFFCNQFELVCSVLAAHHVLAYLASVHIIQILPIHPRVSRPHLQQTPMSRGFPSALHAPHAQEGALEEAPNERSRA